MSHEPASWPEAYGRISATIKTLALSKELKPVDRMLVEEALTYLDTQERLREEHLRAMIARIAAEPSPLLGDLPFVPVDDAQGHADYLLDCRTLRND